MSTSSSEKDDQVMTDTPPTPELNLSFDSEDRAGGFVDEESGKPKSVGFAPTATAAVPAHPLAISSVEVDAASSPGHRRDVSDLDASSNLTGRLTVGSSILTSPETAMHIRSSSHDSNVVEKTEHIGRKHVRNVFRGSVTVGTVNYEQIERIKKSE